MKITERRLRQLIRSVIKENNDLVASQEAEKELEMLGIHTLEDYLSSDMPVSENKYSRNLEEKFLKKMSEFESKYKSLPQHKKDEVDMLAEEIRIRKSVVAVSNAKRISKIMFGTLWLLTFPLVIAVLAVNGIIAVPAFLAAYPWVGTLVVGSFMARMFHHGYDDIEKHSQAITSARDNLSSKEIDLKYRR